MKNFILPDKIETNRLVIRPFLSKDFDAFASFMNSEAATRYLLFSPEQKTPYGIRELFDDTLASYTTEKLVFSLAVADKITDEFIGSVGMAPDEASDNTQIYWSIHPEYWNQGYATEATRALMRYAFNMLGFDCLVAYSSPQNLASIQVAQKTGMKTLGMTKPKGIDLESVVYKITNKEFHT